MEFDKYAVGNVIRKLRKEKKRGRPCLYLRKWGAAED